MKDNFWSVIKGLKKGVAVRINPDGDGLRNIGEKFYNEDITINPIVPDTKKYETLITPYGQPIVRYPVATRVVSVRKVCIPHNAARPKKRKLGGN